MKTKPNITRLRIGISILVLCVGTSWAAEPFENLPDDTVLLDVLGRKVCLKDIEPALDIKEKQQATTDGTPYELWLKQTRASKLWAVISSSYGMNM